MAAIISSQIVWRYTTVSGSAGNTTAGTAAGSLGKYASTTAWTGGSVNDLFPDISGSSNANGEVQYLAVAIVNTNTANSYENVVAFISAEAAGGAIIAIAADTTAASALGSSTAQGLTATSTTAPGSSVTALAYSSPTTAGTGVSLGTIPVNFVKFLWIRRTATNSAALSNDSVSLTTSGDSGSL